MNWLEKLKVKLGGGGVPLPLGTSGAAKGGGTGTVLREPVAAHPAAAVPSDDRWRVGDVILDLYEVKQIHESGGMGLVYRVHHRGWNVDLAVKSPRAEFFRTGGDKENFIRECDAWINLGLHPHVVSCYYVRTLGGVPRVFAEYIEGGSLHDWITNGELYAGGPRSALKRILDISIQTAWGLHFAHEQGMIHQDVKPANVLVMPNGIAKISDFGLAKARTTSSHSGGRGTRLSVLVSSGGMTPAYCSPEQARFENLSRKTDVWSWAVSILEMLCGKVCWPSGEEVPKFFPACLGPSASSRVGPVPKSLIDLLSRCLSYDPAKRPKDLHQVATDLLNIYDEATQAPFSRPSPRPGSLRADQLNNRGLSHLDLGNVPAALKRAWPLTENILA